MCLKGFGIITAENPVNIPLLLTDIDQSAFCKSEFE